MVFGKNGTEKENLDLLKTTKMTKKMENLQTGVIKEKKRKSVFIKKAEFTKSVKGLNKHIAAVIIKFIHK